MQSFCKTKAAPKKESKKKVEWFFYASHNFYREWLCLNQKSELLFVPDVDAIVADFELMGQGLVSSVEILSEPPTPHS